MESVYREREGVCFEIERGSVCRNRERERERERERKRVCVCVKIKRGSVREERKRGSRRDRVCAE